MTSEFSVTFSGAGGHNHDGISSSRIDTTSYSIFDFRTGIIGNNPSRTSLQQTNKISFDNYIIDLLNTKEFSPTLIKIKPNSLTGKILVQGTLTTDKLETNMVLVKQQIQSNNFNGVIDSNQNITNDGTTGWAISSSGQSVFNDVTVRGTILANSGNIGGVVISDSSISADYNTAANTGFILYSNGFADFNEISVRGEIIATSGNIGGYSISGGALLSTASGGTEFSNSWTSEINLDTSSRIVTSTYYVDEINNNGFHNVITFNDVNALEGGIKVESGVYDVDFTIISSYSGYRYGSFGPQDISDERLKNILNKEVDALSILNQISITPFTYKKDRLDSERLGFIAQQLHTVLPNMVIVGGENPEERPWTIVKEQIIPYLTKAIQELFERNEQLEARLQALEGV